MKKLKRITAGVVVMCIALSTPTAAFSSYAAGQSGGKCEAQLQKNISVKGLENISGEIKSNRTLLKIRSENISKIFEKRQLKKYTDCSEIKNIESTQTEVEGAERKDAESKGTGVKDTGIKEAGEETKTKEIETKETEIKETGTEKKETEIKETGTEKTESRDTEDNKTESKDAEATVDKSEEDPPVKVTIIPRITNNGELDYRTCVDNDMKAELCVKLCNEEEDITKDITIEEINATYEVKIQSANTVQIDSIDYLESNEDNSRIYKIDKSRIKFNINGIGKTDYTISLPDINNYEALPVSGSIIVKNSQLYDDDICIIMPGCDKKYTLPEWDAYLKEHNGWIDTQVQIVLSDTGKKYFNQIEIDKEICDNGFTTYTLWAENSDTNASTKDEQNGTRKFAMGIDSNVPVCSSFFTDSVCFEPTKTATEQYYSQDFVLNGCFEDTDSGVEKIEYTTDATMQENSVWETVEATKNKGGKVDFTITLQDGFYKAIAVRAYDYAGNVSETQGFVNNKGEYISVIVDKSEPIMAVNALSGGNPYNGENDNWTNKDVELNAALSNNSCPFAGIYQCDYLYKKIGDTEKIVDDASNTNMTDASENWTSLTLQNGVPQKLIIEEDKNGYYYFRAVSKSGVSSNLFVRERVLIQHQISEPKPIIVGKVEESERKNDWYNKKSGVPTIQFEYPNYDTGVNSKEYDAPVTIHYKLTIENESLDDKVIEKSAEMGVMGSSNAVQNLEGITEFVLTKKNLDDFVIDFGYDKETNESEDGIYTLEYWITDKAGNKSEIQTQVYKIDTHEPTDLAVKLAGSDFAVGHEASIVYEKFYQNQVFGEVNAHYGVSGKGSLEVLKAKKAGEWQGSGGSNMDLIDDNGVVKISPNTRCFLYVKAEDNAGNVSEGWTRGFVVDNMAPNQESESELIIEPIGANKNGFFNDDVKVHVSIKDSPTDNNCAGLMTVTKFVGKDGQDTITGEELFSFTKELPSDDELAKACYFESVQLVNAAENESNEAYITITAVDRSGNEKTSTQLLKIDITKPEAEIIFDNNNAVNNIFYDDVRTATIHIHELNFDEAKVDINVIKDGQPYDYVLSEWKTDESDHYAAVTFSEDGEYTMEVSCTDLADNKSEVVKSERFVIDCTAPVLEIKLNSEKKSAVYENGYSYFNDMVTADIVVTEHNFNVGDYADLLYLNMNGAAISQKGEWNHNGDIHTLKLVFEGDDVYNFSCIYTDLAGNASDKQEKAFIIDTVAPDIHIEGVMNDSANRGDILPVITVFDLNPIYNEADVYDNQMYGTTISVKTGVGDVVDNVIEKGPIDNENGVGYSFTLTDMTDKDDNIYYITVTAQDMAGNESELTYRFSLNRKGSAYDLTSLIDLMSRKYITYMDMEDIRIVEMNIDTVDNFEIFISKNGELGYCAEYSKQVEGSADTGYSIIYYVKRDNFADEGTYRISLYSKDKAGNEVNNTTDINGNEISFIIDNTAPKVVVDGIDAGKMRDAKPREVHISVTDNFKLSEAEFMLVDSKNEIISSWDYMAMVDEGTQLNITIPEHNDKIALLYHVKDAAGNELQIFQTEQTALANFFDTTEKVLHFIDEPSNLPVGGILIIFVILIGVFIGFMALKRSRTI